MARRSSAARKDDAPPVVISIQAFSETAVGSVSLLAQ